MVDLIFPDDFTKGETTMRKYPLPDGTTILYTNFSADIDWPGQKTSSILRYELVKNGAVQRNEISDFVLYWYGIEEFECLLQSVGFVDICHETGYGADGVDSPIIFIATKP
ncbi:MAG: hypothetical protein FWC93_08170 [Defluviitaleaceae bacterium]|nr:hypothetical protein [Defluviitaleaceae bacterium]